MKGFDMSKINKAIAFINIKHCEQTRKDGTPYVWHPLKVALMVKEAGYSEDYQLAALFHDLLEDTDATEGEILELSNEKVLAAVKLLTKTSDNKKTYIDSILKNEIAKVVKSYDRIHNLQEAKTASPKFIAGYLSNTKEKYLGKFCSELDDAYYALYQLHSTI